MIIYLYGPDSYRRRQKEKELKEEYRRKNPGVDIFSLDLEDDPEGWTKAKDFLNQPSMFASSKLLVVRESAAVEEKEWVKALKTEAKSEKVFVLISDTAKPKKTLTFLLQEPVQHQQFEELAGPALAAFVKREASKRGLNLNPLSFAHLLKFFEQKKERSWFAVKELDKLSVLFGKNSEVKKEDLDDIIEADSKEEVFFLARQFLFSRSAAERLRIVEKLILNKEAPAYIFNSLGFQARDAQAEKLATYDVSVKSGRLEYEEALTDLAIGN